MAKFLAVLSIVAILVGTAPSVTASPQAEGQATLVQEFDWIRQGQVGILHLSGPGIQWAYAKFLRQTFLFFPDPRCTEKCGDQIALLSAPMTTTIEFHPMSVKVYYEDGSSETIEGSIRVAYGEFGQEELTLPANLIPLLEPEVTDRENTFLHSLLSNFRPQQDWLNSGFKLPREGHYVSIYGTWRTFNGGTRWYRHSGVDYPMPMGTPIQAAADGRVIYVGAIAIRGNYMVIDHGWGIFTGYGHASETYVKVGDVVVQNEIIGAVGNTGRSTGPHLHFEIGIGGVLVNPLVVVPLLNQLRMEQSNGS
ncbi:MAG: M23 family metallopeptidase [Chloroflexi bacterium]|nr:M23 family metallopeptidase [Chloroflexota bacterium]